MHLLLGLNKLKILFSILTGVFGKRVNILCSVGCISRPMSSRNHNAANQEIVIDSYQSFFRKLDILLSKKQQGAKFYLFLLNHFFGFDTYHIQYFQQIWHNRRNKWKVTIYIHNTYYKYEGMILNRSENSVSVSKNLLNCKIVKSMEISFSLRLLLRR